MRILLDECLPRRLGILLAGHSVKTAPEMGWAGIENGRLLAQAEKRFDVLITVDRKLPDQQDLSKFRIAVIILRCSTNRLEDLKPLVPDILAKLTSAKKGKAVHIPQ